MDKVTHWPLSCLSDYPVTAVILLTEKQLLNSTRSHLASQTRHLISTMRPASSSQYALTSFFFVFFLIFHVKL